MFRQLIHQHWLPFVLGGFSVVLFYSTFIFVTAFNPELDELNSGTAQQEQGNETHVLLETVFIDGVSREEHRYETIHSMEDFWYNYEEWQVVHYESGFIHFQQNLLDLSPEVKRNGYIGLTEQQDIVLYTGQPEAKVIIKEFDQLNATNLSEEERIQLQTGIRVSSLGEYNQWLDQLAS